MYIYILNKCVRLGYWSPPNLHVTPEEEEEEEIIERGGLIRAILSEKIFDSLY